MYIILHFFCTKYLGISQNSRCVLSIRGDDMLCMMFLELPSNMADSFIDDIRVAFWFISMLTISQTQWVPVNENLDTNKMFILNVILTHFH